MANRTARYGDERRIGPLLVLVSVGLLLCTSCGDGVHAQLSADQRKLVDEFGDPDCFTVAMFDEDTGEGRLEPQRVETWFYAQYQTSFTFLNGAFAASGRFETAPTNADYVNVRPSQFVAYSSWEAVRSALGITEFVRVDAASLDLRTPGVPEGISVVLADRMMLGFDQDRLVLVQTIPSSRKEGS